MRIVGSSLKVLESLEKEEPIKMVPALLNLFWTIAIIADIDDVIGASREPETDSNGPPAWPNYSGATFSCSKDL